MGVTTGTVLQTVVYEVDWRVRTVGSVTTEVDVLVLVTKELLVQIRMRISILTYQQPSW